LSKEVDEGNFRQDLYYRLNVINLAMPPLRDREGDVAELADLILNRLAKDYAAPKPRISEAALQALTNYDFPGNVRELENLLERAFTLCEDNQITPVDLNLSAATTDELSPRANVPDVRREDNEEPSMDGTPAEIPSGLAPNESLESFLEKVERTLITRALENNRWNKTAAAKDLGITFRALRYRLKKLEME